MSKSKKDKQKLVDEGCLWYNCEYLSHVLHWELSLCAQRTIINQILILCCCISVYFCIQIWNAVTDTSVILEKLTRCKSDRIAAIQWNAGGTVLYGYVMGTKIS